MIQTRWTEFIRQSGNTARFSWLSDFSTTVDDIIFKQVTSTAATNIPPYDPYLLEVNISNASTLLDRCLIYRKEMYDLEEQGVRRVLEYTLYDNQRDAQRTLELAENIEEQRRAERDGQTAASAIFATAKDNVLATGFKAIADATESSADTAWKYEKDVRKKAVLTKWNALDEYQQTLEARHQTPGNALNYKERRSRVQKLLERDVLNAFLRLRCIEKGANYLYGASFRLPTPIDPSQSTDSYLDLMVIFLRDVIDALEVESLREVDFDHVVPLTQGRWDRKTGTFISRIDLPTWNAAIGPGGPGYVATDLSHNEFTSAVLRVRLRGFAVSCAAPSPEAAYSHLKRFAAVIFPPDAPDLFSPRAVRERNPIVVEDIRITEPGNIRPIVYDSITNIDPRGVWRIQVSSRSFYTDASQRKRATDGVSSISDLRLHLRLRAVLATDAGSWANFAW